MKRCVLVVLVACFVVAASVGRPVQGYNSAGHVYIAERAIGSFNANALYGAMAPDIIGYLPEPLLTLLEPNHLYFDLVSKAVTVPERWFALGWATHNSMWGTDYYAHVKPFNEGEYGYVVEKGNLLGSYLPGLPNASGVGHIAVEMAIDILLQQRDPLLAMKTYQAAAGRTGNVSMFMWQSGVFLDTLDKKTVNEADAAFRQVTMEYAMALGATSPTDLTAMATFASKMAAEAYGMEITPEQAGQIIGLALSLCQDDYYPTIEEAIAGIHEQLAAGK